MNNRNKENVKVQALILLLSTLLLGGKFIAYFITGSNLILTDALESIVNVVAGALGLYSLYLAAKPKDANHPYGHGKIEFITASVEGILIMMAGIGIIAKSIYSFIFPEPIVQLETGLIIVAATGLVNFFMGYWVERRGKNMSSAVLAAGGKHLKSDAYSTAAMVVGLGVVYFTDIQELDYAVAILFGCVILFTGYKIVKTNIGGIMDEADYDLITKIIEVLQTNRAPAWVDVHNMRLIKYGDTYHIDCHLTLPYYLNVEEAHHEVDKLEKRVNSHFENTVEVFIHTDPCIETSCKVCILDTCPVRKHPFEGKETWTLENVMRNRKHGIPAS